ncbi:MAG: Carbohydrate kinase [Gemmatimonadetes bacterium]|nr:Carbohydrate kinase [Gemmatimonadota bacterium]
MKQRGAGSYLAFDLGASSGRAVLGTLDGSVMRMDEIHRFHTPILEENDHLYWDVEALWSDMRTALTKAFSATKELRSISVDSWAVDYVPLDADGNALRNPYCYRDRRTAGRLDTAIRVAGGADALYDRTGIQFLPFNTLPQVIADIEDEPDVVRATATRLLIAEYFLYRLSGIKVAEATMASTTQLVDARSGEWASSLIAAAGDDEKRWPPIVRCGSVLGPMLPALLHDGVREQPVILATCAHDTAAAVAAVPASPGRHWAFISSGTWSLVGAELDAAVLTRDAREAGFTNEAGLDGSVRFLSNRAGMWVLEECRREWAAQHTTLSHDELMQAAETALSMGAVVDLNAAPFAERGGMIGKLAAACGQSGIPLPSTVGETARLILESLAASHADALDELSSLTGTVIDDVHIVGGGAMNDLLNQLTALRSGRRILAGPEEATVLGNLLVQARTLGDLPPGVSVREAARSSTRIREFTPRTGALSSSAASLAL